MEYNKPRVFQPTRIQVVDENGGLTPIKGGWDTNSEPGVLPVNPERYYTIGGDGVLELSFRGGPRSTPMRMV